MAPRFPPGRRRTYRITTNVTATEYATIVARAKDSGLSMATYVRLVLLSGVTAV